MAPDKLRPKARLSLITPVSKVIVTHSKTNLNKWMAVRYPVIPELYIVSALQLLLEKEAKKWEPQNKITV